MLLQAYDKEQPTTNSSYKFVINVLKAEYFLLFVGGKNKKIAFDYEINVQVKKNLIMDFFNLKYNCI